MEKKAPLKKGTVKRMESVIEVEPMTIDQFVKVKEEKPKARVKPAPKKPTKAKKAFFTVDNVMFFLAGYSAVLITLLVLK